MQNCIVATQIIKNIIQSLVIVRSFNQIFGATVWTLLVQSTVDTRLRTWEWPATGCFTFYSWWWR